MTATAAPVAGRFAPSVLDPQDVVLVEAWDLQADGYFGFRPSQETRDFYRSRMAPEARERGGFSRCTICGAHLRYCVVVMLSSTGEFFIVGEDCAANVDLAAEIGQKVTALRASAKEGRDNLRRRQEADSYLAENLLVATAFAFLDSYFADDLFSALYRFGRLTDRQEAALLKSFDRWIAAEERKAIEAERPTAPVVEGRIQVEGDVLSVKWQDNAYGGSLKMLVRDDRGFKVWGTVPSALYGSDLDRGDRIRFTATVEKSQDDETFGFYKRPTKTEVLPKA